MSLYGFVIMPNHIHLIAYADNLLEGVIKDFKRFTASTINSLLREDGRLSILEQWAAMKPEPPPGSVAPARPRGAGAFLRSVHGA